MNGSEQIQSEATSLYDLSANNINGENTPLKNFNNKKAIIVVNVACQCGLTSDHYTQLVQLYKQYKSQGLEILGFPCNQFGAQEPWAESEILSYTQKTFNVEFPLFSKIDVNGENTHPVYKYLRRNSELFQNNAATKIPWNFAKFLVDGKTGKVVQYFSPKVNPVEMEQQIKQLLL
ncbi:phospholipid hydroperoxide glutathione peroxidase (macronuclear) [Tetrahymena thermophila SB210]|uniref:Glutathione peroxidase n=1 Tax=Tetrahymena thermophila (strain SB210) TaxID=312017 RepID=Q241T1_TETTS|nr:phospholipid hydroperoxide glutathione peroxidase [Tetrahymena thermophila SB210]EAS02489.1 phospholipid hydroperoxide glutathione peroxidase [Tetrahymena thermophila SB210]|eukprot:XP_001022734.1 phospholipid hydroperoxide glutathione peroxidase [Tetrahymena thermophila SB210]